MNGSYRDNRPLNPLHALLLGFPAALFTAVLLGDIAHRFDDTPAWARLAACLIAGGVASGGLVFLWVLAGLVRAGAGRLRRSLVYAALLLATSAFGVANAVVHNVGGWAATPAQLALSAAAGAAALLAAWTGYLGVPRQSGC